MKTSIFFAIIFVLALAVNAQADPLAFSNVTVLSSGNAPAINLFANQNTVLFGPQLTFSTDITGTLPPGATDTLRVTYSDSLGNIIIQNFQLPLFGSINPPVSLVFGITAPAMSFNGVPATLTLDLLQTSPDFAIPSGPNAGQLVNSYTFSFNVAQPVPEPASMALLASGLSAFGVYARKRWRKNKKT